MIGPDTTEAGLRIGDLARRAGVTVETVRYYERRGLLQRPARSPGGHRAFGSDAVALLRGIRAAQRLGFTLAEIEEMVDISEGRVGADRVRARAEAKIHEVDAKIRALRAMRTSLERVIEAECESLVGCADTDCCPVRDAAAPDPARAS